MNLTEWIHHRYVHGRRSQVLAERLAQLLPPAAHVLDVGCGDGLIAHLIQERRPDLRTTGIDVLVRGHTWIEVQAFDGRRFPHADRSVDVVTFVDVLHHTEDPMVLLREAARVSRGTVVIKDHVLGGWLAWPTLRFMDRVGNRRHGVTLPHNYWRRQQWDEAFRTLGVRVASWSQQLHLYPWPAGIVFDRCLHFIARLDLPG